MVFVKLGAGLFAWNKNLFVVLYEDFVLDIALHPFEGAQEATGYKVTDVAQGGVGRDPGEFGIVLCGELALVAVEV